MMGLWGLFGAALLPACMILWQRHKKKRCLHAEVGVTASGKAICFGCLKVAPIETLVQEANDRYFMRDQRRRGSDD